MSGSTTGGGGFFIEEVSGMKVTAEYNGVSYTFDPQAQAMKDLGAMEETAENRVALERKTLEYMKTARIRAETGARLRYIRNTASKQSLTDEELDAILSEAWTNR
jgi:methylaspartate ammonia-lyase